jgi:hypothetical protein
VQDKIEAHFSSQLIKVEKEVLKPSENANPHFQAVILDFSIDKKRRSSAKGEKRKNQQNDDNESPGPVR